MKTDLELLIYAMDHELTEKEQLRLESALENSEGLRAEQQKLLNLRKMFSQFEADDDPTFANKIMDSIHSGKEADIIDFNKTVIQLFPKVAAACVGVLLIAFSALYFSDVNIANDALVGIEELNVEDAYTYFEY